MATGIEQLYRDILGRAPDPGGLAYWAQQFGGDISPEERQAFVNAANVELANRPAEERAQLSPATGGEFVSDSTPAASSAPASQFSVADLYRQLLGREPDPQGLAYWQQQFGSDIDPTEIETFKNVAREVHRTSTPEQQRQNAPKPSFDIGPMAPLPTPPLGKYASIEDLYKDLLGRDPDTQGLEYWKSTLMSPSSPGGAAITPEEVESFKNSAREVHRTSTPEQQRQNAPKPGFDIGAFSTKGTETGFRGEKLDPSQSTLSPNFADYVYKMLAKGEQAAGLPYQEYTGKRFAETSPALQQGIGAYLNLAPPSQFGEATGIARLVAEQAARGGEYRPGYFSTDSFTDPYAVQSYMSPYMQAVVDRQQREAIRADDIARQSRQAQFAQRGAYGGSRQAIEEAEAQRNLQTRMGDIQALGLQSAYQQAQQQFNTEQQARMEAQKAIEASRQFGAGYGLKALDPQLQAAQQMGTLGVSSGDYLLRGLSGLMEAGKTQQQLAQQPYDFGFQQWQESQKYPYQQATYMGSLLSGLPLRAAGYDAGTSGLGGLLGGLATGAGIYGALNK